MDGQALADRGGPAPAYVSVFEARMLQLRAESLELDVQNARLTSCKATRDQRNELWARDKELDRLVGEISFLKLEVLNWRKKLSMCQLRLVSAEEDAKLYQGNNAILTSRLADAATEQEHLQRQIAGLQDELQQMRSVLNDEQSAVQESLSAKDKELARLQQCVTELKTQQAELKAVLTNQQADKDALSQQCSTLQSQIAALKDAQTAQQKALEHSERALSQSDSERASLETKLKASEAALAETRHQKMLAEQAQAQLSGMAQATTQMKREWEEHVNRIAEDRVKIVSERAKAVEDQLQSQLTQLRQQLEQERKYRVSVEPDLRAQSQALKQQEAAHTRALQDIKKQMQSKDDALSALKRRVEELELMDEEMQANRAHANVNNLINTLLPAAAPQPEAAPAAQQAKAAVPQATQPSPARKSQGAVQPHEAPALPVSESREHQGRGAQASQQAEPHQRSTGAASQPLASQVEPAESEDTAQPSSPEAEVARKPQRGGRRASSKPPASAERVPASEERPKRQAGRAALARLQQVQEEEEGEGGDTDTGVNDGDISPLPATQPLASQPAADAASKGAARSKRGVSVSQAEPKDNKRTKRTQSRKQDPATDAAEDPAPADDDTMTNTQTQDNPADDTTAAGPSTRPASLLGTARQPVGSQPTGAAGTARQDAEPPPTVLRSRVLDNPLVALNEKVLQRAAAMRASVSTATKQALRPTMLISTIASARSNLTAAAKRKQLPKLTGSKAGADRLPPGMLAESLTAPKLVNRN